MRLGPGRECSSAPAADRGVRELVVGSVLALAAAACAAPARLDLRLGFEADGTPTREWREAVERHTGAAPRWERRPPTPAESAWLELARSRRAAWEERIPELCVPFEGVHAPAT